MTAYNYRTMRYVASGTRSLMFTIRGRYSEMKHLGIGGLDQAMVIHNNRIVSAITVIMPHRIIDEVRRLYYEARY